VPSDATVPIALVQMSFTDNREANVARAAELVTQAGAAGARIVCLPELATTQYFCHEVDARYFDLAETIPGPSTRTMADAARAAGAYVILPLYERDADGALYNTAVVLTPDGDVVGTYRKASIPHITNEHMTWAEKYYFRPGNLGFPVFETSLGVSFGILICYDRHFPEAARALALAGADVIFVPTATASGRDIWELELRGHAVANLLWVAGVNRVGVDVGGSDTHFYGASHVVAPSGAVVISAGERAEETVHWQIDTAHSARLREEWGFFRDRRPDAYGALVISSSTAASP
jgi:beta-ureidopropionase